MHLLISGESKDSHFVMYNTICTQIRTYKGIKYDWENRGDLNKLEEKETIVIEGGGGNVTSIWPILKF